jgi:type IV secretory pathway TraG/TraD family ATPase VirD4
MNWLPDISLGQLRANLARNGPELYVGTTGRGLVWAGPQQALLVLGPPRSGKTSSLVVPNVLAAPGPVLVTSTKPDVLQATMASRSQLGRCWLLDPSGTLQTPPGASVLRWSPVAAAHSWEEALVTARVMTAAARPHGSYGDSAHWTERAEALLAPLLHAAALANTGMRQVLTWALRHDAHTPMAVLGAKGGGEASVAADVLAGIAATEERERSGIFSTAAGTLAAYRSSRALDLADQPNFDPSRFPEGADTVYVCGPARYQALMAPVVVAFLEQVRAATYAAAAGGRPHLPVTLVLDEVANVAPLPDLPAMVSEGGGQGLLTLACLQDLSQARARWGQAAEGFFSLFGTKVLLPGIGDIKTLEAVSRLAGHVDVPVESITRSAWWSGRPWASTTFSWRRQARLPVDQAHSLPPGSALVVAGARPPALAWLTPWWGYPPFAEARLARLPPSWEPPRASPSAPVVPVPLPPSPLPGGTPASADLSVQWRRVPRQRPLQPPPPRA